MFFPRFLEIRQVANKALLLETERDPYPMPALESVSDFLVSEWPNNLHGNVLVPLTSIC